MVGLFICMLSIHFALLVEDIYEEYEQIFNFERDILGFEIKKNKSYLKHLGCE